MTENTGLLTFLGHSFSAASLDGQIWLRADELGHAMAMANPEQDVLRVHQANWQQFSDRLTAFVEVETQEGARPMRVFNLLGAYVLSTFVLTQEAQQFRRWLLETLVYLQIDARREFQRLIEQNEVLEKRIAALEAEMAEIRHAFQEGMGRTGETHGKDWLDGEFRTLREQQERQSGMMEELARALEAAPRLPEARTGRRVELSGELEQLYKLRIQQLDQVDILREIVAELRAAQQLPDAPEYPPRMLSLEGPFPVYLGRIGGRDCPVVSARDLHAFLNTGQEYGGWAAWHTAVGHGLAEHIDYEHLRWLRPEGMHVGTGNYILSLGAVIDIVRGEDDGIARHVRDFILECRQRLSAWMADSLEPPVAPLPDCLGDGNEAGADGPMLFHFDDLPIRVERDEQGRDWWCAKDVCAVLGYANDSKAIKDHCRPDGVTKRYPILDSLGRTQHPAFINDPNFYRLIAKSQKPEAERFERWVFEEVVPAVNKTGRYEHPTHGKVVQPAVPASEAPPRPAIAAKPATTGAQPAKPKARKPKTQASQAGKESRR